MTGLDRADFTTHQARSILRRLGFGVHRRGADHRRSTAVRAGPHGGVEAAQLQRYVGRWVAQDGLEAVDAGDVAQITGATPRSVSRWTGSKAIPRRDAEDRLLELKAVVDVLRSVLREEPARLWLRSPNADLDWRNPLELIAEGEYRRVISSILAIAEA